MDVVQTAQPPPYHFMFDASSNALGAGGMMEVKKYPSAAAEKYLSGFRQFKPVPGRALVYDARGNWGQKHYYKYTPIRQQDGASGVLQQIAQPNAYKYKVANLGRLGRVDPQLPRGGNIMRIVGVGGDDDMRAFDSNYDWRNSGQPGPADMRPKTDVGRADLPGINDGKQPFPNPTQTGEIGAQTDATPMGEISAQTDMTASDIEDMLSMIDDMGARVILLEREIKRFQRDVRNAATNTTARGTSTQSSQTVNAEDIQNRINALASEYREIYAQMRELIDRRGVQTRQIKVKITRLDNKLQAVRTQLVNLMREEGGYNAQQTAEALAEFDRLNSVSGQAPPPQGGSSSSAQQPNIPEEILRVPREQRDAVIQARWIARRITDLFSTYLQTARVQQISDAVQNVIIQLFGRASAAIPTLITNIMAVITQNPPSTPAEARLLAEQIIVMARNAYTQNL